MWHRTGQSWRHGGGRWREHGRARCPAQPPTLPPISHDPRRRSLKFCLSGLTNPARSRIAFQWSAVPSWLVQGPNFLHSWHRVEGGNKEQDCERSAREARARKVGLMAGCVVVWLIAAQAAGHACSMLPRHAHQRSYWLHSEGNQSGRTPIEPIMADHRRQGRAMEAGVLTNQSPDVVRNRCKWATLERAGINQLWGSLAWPVFPCVSPACRPTTCRRRARFFFPLARCVYPTRPVQLGTCALSLS